MKRRSRTRRVLKWVGLVGCLLTICAGILSMFWEPEVGLLTEGGAHFVIVRLRFGSMNFFLVNDEAGMLTGALNTVYGGGRWRRISAIDPPRREFSWLPWLREARTPRGESLFSEIDIPLWTILVVIGVPTAFLWYRDRRRPKGHCRSCGYDLTGNVSGVCPECGTDAWDARAHR